MDICSAIIELTKDSETGSASVSVNAEDYSQITWHDSNPNNITVDQIKAKQAEFKAAYDAKEYQRKRKPEYKSWEEQMDLMYHSMDDWKAHCKAVRDKYPKP